MPVHEVKVHGRGPAIWPEHKPLPEVQLLQATTPLSIWNAVYQGMAKQPAGNIFKRKWWSNGQARYDITDRGLVNSCYARYLAFDTAEKNKPEEDTDFTAMVMAELWPDYRLAFRYMHNERMEFPQLPDFITQAAVRWNQDGKLKGILIEDKSSGTSALQTLAAAGAPWLRELLIPFMPTTDKVTRAEQAAVWCKNACIMLPRPQLDLYWLVDMEDQIFDFPQGAHDDIVDAFSMLILYLENILEAGWRARGEFAHA